MKYTLFLVVAVCTLRGVAFAQNVAEAGLLDPGSMREFSDGSLEYETNRLWQVWMADPGREASIDEQVRDITKGAALVWANMQWAKTTYPSASSRIESIDEAMKSAPNSVMLRALRGEAVAEAGVRDQIQESLELLRSMHTDGVLPIRTLYLACVLCREANTVHQREIEAEAREIAEETLTSVLTKVPADFMEQRYVASNILPLARPYCKYMDLATVAEEAAKVAEDPWLAYVFAGEVRRWQAWEARGSGMAHTVNDDGWIGFHGYMEKSAELLMKAHEIRPEAPEAAASMIDVAKNLSGDLDASTAWFGEVFMAQKSWMPAITDYYFALRPRWFGSVEQMSHFTQWLTSHAADSEDIANYLFRATDQIAFELGSFREVWNDDALAECISAEMRRQIEVGRQPGNARQRLLGIAWARKDWSLAAELVTEIGDNDAWFTLKQFHVHPSRILDDVLLQNIDDAPGIEQALEDEDNEMYSRASEMLSQALDDERLTGASREAINRRIVSCDMNAKYKEGEEVMIAADPDLKGWEVWRGRAHTLEDTVYLGDDEEYAWLRPDLDPGERYELHLTMLKPEGEGDAWSMFVLGHRWHMFEQWHTAWIRWHDGVGWFQYQFDGKSSAGVDVPTDDGRIELHIVCYDGDLLISADDKTLYRGPLTQGLSYTPGSRIYLSTWLRGNGRYAGFQNIRIKKLTKRPAALN
ncbi:MAG: hypothetical protein Phyf2KO_22070 [Phycisphaerales bacterium]